MKNIPIALKIKSFANLAWRKFRRYTVLVFVIVIFGLYGGLVFQIGALSQVEPDETAVREQLGKIKRLKIDQESVDKIQKLEDESVGVQSLFKAARDNPFQDN